MRGPYVGGHDKAADHDNNHYHLGLPGAVVAGLEPTTLPPGFRVVRCPPSKSVKHTNTALPMRAVLS